MYENDYLGVEIEDDAWKGWVIDMKRGDPTKTKDDTSELNIW